MTALAEPDYYDDFDSDFRSELDAKYEEGFGYSPAIDDEDDDGLDDLFAGIFDDDEDDDGRPAARSAQPKKAVARATARTAAPKAEPGNGRTAASEVVVTTVAERRAAPAPQAVPDAEAASAPEAVAVPAGDAADEVADEVAAAARRAAEKARAAADRAAAAAKAAVAHAVAKAAAAKAAAAEASAAEEAAQEALAASNAAEEDALRAAAQLELVLAAPSASHGPTSGSQDPTSASGGVTSGVQDLTSASGGVTSAVEAVAPAPADPNFAPHIAPVNQHVEFLRKLRPGFEVPYVDPMHSVDECRIVSLFSNTGEASPRGYVWAGDDAAATRLLGLQYQLGLRPEWTMPWNAYPWFTPGEANGKLTPEQLHAGLKPLLTFLKTVPRVSAIVAHGTEANRLAQMLLKTDNPLIWRRGLKVYKARALHGRAFAGSKERQTEWLIEMGRSYADAMARAGLQAGRP